MQRISWIEPGSRGHEVLAKVLEGLTNSQIAEELEISERTVKNHMTVIYAQFHHRRHHGRNELLGELFQILDKERGYSLKDILNGMTKERFSTDEWVILRLMFEGLSRKEVGEEIGLQEKTVAGKLIPIYAKLGISGRGIEGFIGHLTKMIGDNSPDVAEILLRRHRGYTAED